MPTPKLTVTISEAHAASPVMRTTHASFVITTLGASSAPTTTSLVHGIRASHSRKKHQRTNTGPSIRNLSQVSTPFLLSSSFHWHTFASQCQWHPRQGWGYHLSSWMLSCSSSTILLPLYRQSHPIPRQNRWMTEHFITWTIVYH